MGTINNDSCMDKIRARVGICARCGHSETYSAHHVAGLEYHAFLDAGDEPIFVLRAQDVTAVVTIQEWVKRNPQLPEEKREEAYQLCGKMLAWPKKKEAD